MTTTQKINTELPVIATDVGLLSLGAIVTRIAFGAIDGKRTPGKFTFTPVIALILAILIASFSSDRRVRMSVFGVALYSFLALAFRDSGGLGKLQGLIGLAGNSPEPPMLPVGNLTFYDDTHLEGLGCDECGGTCGDTPLGAKTNEVIILEPVTALDGCGCTKLLGLGNVTQYLTATQLSEMRSLCPGLENSLNIAIDELLAQNKNITGVILNLSNCGGEVLFEEKYTTVPTTDVQPYDPTQVYDPYASVPVGGFIMDGSCIDGVVLFSLRQKTATAAGGYSVIELVRVDDKVHTNVRYTIQENGVTIHSGQVRNGQTTQFYIENGKPDKTYTGQIEITVNGEMLFFQENVNCFFSNKSGSVQVQVSVPPKTVTPTTMPASPVSAFTYEVNNCSSRVQFFDNSQNAYSRRWEFPGNVFLTEKNPSVNLNPGLQTVRLTAYGNDGTAVLSEQIINVPENKPNPTVSFTASTQPNSRMVSFRSSVQNGVQYEWDFGDGITGGSPNPTHQYATSGTKKVTLKVRNECGTTEYSLNIVVPEIETVLPTYTPAVPEPSMIALQPYAILPGTEYCDPVQTPTETPVPRETVMVRNNTPTVPIPTTDNGQYLLPVDPKINCPGNGCDPCNTCFSDTLKNIKRKAIRNNTRQTRYNL